MRICGIPECGRPHRVRDMCDMHYQRWKTKGSPYTLKKLYRNGRTTHPLYPVYASMKDRCMNPNNSHYASYGGRDIKVTERWLGAYGFTNFTEDMGERPQGYSIDRIDNDGNYEPSNCRWADNSLQAYNKRISPRNKSGITGVYIHKATNKWTAQVKRSGVTKHLGLFSSREEAIKAREEATAKLWEDVC